MLLALLFVAKRLYRELRQRSQGERERISDYVAAFQSILRRFDPPVSDKRQVAIILEGLHQQYKRYLETKTFKNLSQFKETGLDLEYQPTKNTRASKRKAKVKDNGPKGEVAAAAAQGTKPQATNRSSQQAAQLNVVAQPPLAQVFSAPSLIPQHRGRANGDQVDNAKEQRPFAGACFSCGVVGHQRSQCPTAQNTRPIACYKCRQPGHYANSCPLKPTEAKPICQTNGAESRSRDESSSLSTGVAPMDTSEAAPMDTSEAAPMDTLVAPPALVTSAGGYWLNGAGALTPVAEELRALRLKYLEGNR
ncbi:uncharacterized protein LOC131675280 [Phymastichus coffea]|uniref:uncharacterized protein LOC131675280 n=1 Tax=Phymastichus coffea TaxID=108790 RepID=UPI00273AAAE2|nr:uncharacterized protein LOC131675280 [Phymastichus coffea]